MFHWSTCAVHNAPALPIGRCNCGGLNLTDDCLKYGIAAFVTGSGGVRFLVDHMGAEGFVEVHVLPAGALIALAAAANLPDIHDRVVVLGHPDDMDLNDAREAIVAQLKALPLPQGLAGNIGQHTQTPPGPMPVDVR